MKKFSIILLALLVVLACMAPVAVADVQPKAEPGAFTLIASDLGTLEVVPGLYSTTAVAYVECLNFKYTTGRTARAAPDYYKTRGLFTASAPISAVVPGVGST